MISQTRYGGQGCLHSHMYRSAVAPKLCGEMWWRIDALVYSACKAWSSLWKVCRMNIEQTTIQRQKWDQQKGFGNHWCGENTVTAINECLINILMCLCLTNLPHIYTNAKKLGKGFKFNPTQSRKSQNNPFYDHIVKCKWHFFLSISCKWKQM